MARKPDQIKIDFSQKSSSDGKQKWTIELVVESDVLILPQALSQRGFLPDLEQLLGKGIKQIIADYIQSADTCLSAASHKASPKNKPNPVRHEDRQPPNQSAQAPSEMADLLLTADEFEELNHQYLPGKTN